MHEKKCSMAMVAFFTAASFAMPLFFNARAQAVVDNTTLIGKFMCGYQGWFQCPGDGSGGGWFHWFNAQDASYSGLKCDLFPDLTEFSANELYATNMKYPDGSTVKLFSSYKTNTELLHFQWMQEHDIDGVWIQRFGPKHVGWNDFTNKVLLNCKQAAETYGRVFTVMYDVTGANNATLFNDITSDWEYLVDTLKITASPRYLNHKGKPLVSVWGYGFSDRSITADVATKIDQWFKTDAPAKYQATVMVGVVSNGATHWRTLPEPWASAIRTADIISPWFVGSFGDIGGADNFRTTRIVPDIAECKSLGKEYLPVVFPGFSWANMTANPSMRNQIPRMGGTFYWEQIYNAVSAGATMLYGAMFDEVDEGTAILKACPKKSLAPADWWLTLDADGYNNLPSDWYLRLAGEAGRLLKGNRPLSKTMPLNPNNPDSGWVAVGTREPLRQSALREEINVRNGILYLPQSLKGNLAVTVTRLSGERVVEINCENAASSQLPLFSPTALSSGVYLVRVKAGGRMIESKPVLVSH
jgi:hypothetical protein